MRVFISYCFDDESVAQRLSYFLNEQRDVKAFCYADERRQAQSWLAQIGVEIARAGAFVALLGARTGEVQEQEIRVSHGRRNDLRRCVVLVEGARIPPSLLVALDGLHPIPMEALEPDLEAVARGIVEALGKASDWVPVSEIPRGYSFEYEKEIIETYAANRGALRGRPLEAGCPPTWPEVENDREGEGIPNPVSDETIGSYRDDASRVLVDARFRTGQVAGAGAAAAPAPLTMLEAGPRQRLHYPRAGRNELNIGVIVSGGIAPGINAVLAGILARHELYREKAQGMGARYTLNLRGARDGFNGLLRPSGLTPIPAGVVREAANTAGSLLTTSRAPDLLRPGTLHRAAVTAANELDILYVIGGDGSMRAAHAIWKAARDAGRKLSVVGIPKTMDNDILWVWQSFGFMSAVEWAENAIRQLHTEASSNPRLCVTQLFGSDSGFVVSHAALASGVCDLALIPEVQFDLSAVSRYVRSRLQRRLEDAAHEAPPHAMVVMAETAVPKDWSRYRNNGDYTRLQLTKEEWLAIEAFDADGRRVIGQTPDELRRGGLKLVSGVLQADIQRMDQDYWREFRVFTSEPRHLIRSIRPSALDVIFAERLGSLAVDNAMAGYTDFMISQWLTEYVLVPLRLVVLGRKRVPRTGIFWKSVLAATGQPSVLTEDAP